jgi:hypothetical protein
MIRSRNQFVWVVATWAAVVAPTIPQACGCPCAESPSSCSQACCTAKAPDAICRCQLDARHDQPLAPAKIASPAFGHHEQAATPAAFTIEVPRDLSVSREYVAASLAVPIRPPRILFGVWRN